MKTKTLNTIQTIANVCRIICLVVFIVTIVGGVGCLVGIFSLAVIPDSFSIGGVTIHGIISKSADISDGACYAAMAVGAIVCACAAVLAKIGENYFKHELAAGTPFTFEGAKELLRYGICTVCISAGASTVAAIVFAVTESLFGSTDVMHFDYGFSIGVGVLLIIMSLICKHGAEISGQKDVPEEE